MCDGQYLANGADGQFRPALVNIESEAHPVQVCFCFIDTSTVMPPALLGKDGDAGG